MAIIIIIFAVILIGHMVCYGQEPIVIDDFSGALNTNFSVLQMKPNQAREFLNWDLVKKYNTLRPRSGYIKFGSHNKNQSLISLCISESDKSFA